MDTCYFHTPAFSDLWSSWQVDNERLVASGQKSMNVNVFSFKGNAALANAAQLLLDGESHDKAGDFAKCHVRREKLAHADVEERI